jgi:hypothetical protein
VRPEWDFGLDCLLLGLSPTDVERLCSRRLIPLLRLFVLNSHIYPAGYLEGSHPDNTTKLRITNNGLFDLHVDFSLKSKVSDAHHLHLSPLGGKSRCSCTRPPALLCRSLPPRRRRVIPRRSRPTRRRALQPVFRVA